jgi:hypothetical protein
MWVAMSPLLLLFTLLLCSLCLLLLLVTPSVRAQCEGDISTDTYNALEALYDATNGPNWHYANDSMKWTFPSPLNEPCSLPWSGIECVSTFYGCDVVTLLLDKHLLVGQLPAALYTIHSLVTLNLGPTGSVEHYRAALLTLVD